MDHFNPLTEVELLKIRNSDLKALYQIVFDQPPKTTLKTKKLLVEALLNHVTQEHLAKQKKMIVKEKDQNLARYNFQVGDIVYGVDRYIYTTYFYRVDGFTKAGSIHLAQLGKIEENIRLDGATSKDKVTPLLTETIEPVTFRKSKMGIYAKGDIVIHGKYNPREDYYDNRYY